MVTIRSVQRAGSVLSLAMTLALGLGQAGTAQAQDAYPSKPIRLLSCCTGFPENAARVIAAAMQEQLKDHPVIVETKAGANGILAADYVAKQPGDGYTIFIGTNSTHAANQSLFKKLPYDYIKDFTPLAGVARGALLFVVRADLPVRNIAELTAMAKKEPGKLTYGEGSSSAMVAVELYKLIAGLDIRRIPYKTNPQVTTDMLGGRVDMAANDGGSLIPHVQSGKLRAMAITGPRRLAVLPDVPTFQEAGVPGYELTFWNAAYLPSSTPPALVTRVNQIFVAALNHPKVKEHLTRTLTESFAPTPDELMKFQIAEHDKWKRVLQAAGVQPE